MSIEIKKQNVSLGIPITLPTAQEKVLQKIKMNLSWRVDQLRNT